MPLLMKRWRDWLMNDLRPLLRLGPKPQALHFSYEKAGLVLHDPYVPWNADAILVEATLRLPASARRKTDFQLRLPEREPILADSLRAEESGERYRLLFRFSNVPSRNFDGELLWRNHLLGKITLPVFSSQVFLQQLRLDMPTFFVRLGSQSVACQTFVATQGKALQASAVLSSQSGSLAPLMDLGVRVKFRSEKDKIDHEVPVPLCSSQLQARQALLTAVPPKLPKRLGFWSATWMVGDQVLGAQRVRAISQRMFHNSLRISDTRFVVVDKKQSVAVRRQLPAMTEVSRLGPCFMVSSREPGMAAICTLQVYAQIPGGVQAPLLLEQEILITDGPAMFAPGTVDVSEFGQMSAFELCFQNRPLGALPLSPVPSASFNNEGGFKPPADFIWTPAADEELSERLQKLVNGQG
ncbi:MAG TPA: hypothetical protein VKS79_10940 [Gemmataceae bacterium]|nr:hypothetical protein [Gemmataceae bacterium]